MEILSLWCFPCLPWRTSSSLGLYRPLPMFCCFSPSLLHLTSFNTREISPFLCVLLHLSNPEMLIKLFGKGEVDAKTGYEAYPFLFRAAIIQRSMGDQVVDQSGKLIVIGADIPPIRVMTILSFDISLRTRSCTIQLTGFIYPNLPPAG